MSAQAWERMFPITYHHSESGRRFILYLERSLVPPPSHPNGLGANGTTVTWTAASPPAITVQAEQLREQAEAAP